MLYLCWALYLQKRPQHGTLRHQFCFVQVNKFKARFAGSALGDVVTLSESGAAESEEENK